MVVFPFSRPKFFNNSFYLMAERRPCFYKITKVRPQLIHLFFFSFKCCGLKKIVSFFGAATTYLFFFKAAPKDDFLNRFPARQDSINNWFSVLSGCYLHDSTD